MFRTILLLINISFLLSKGLHKIIHEKMNNVFMRISNKKQAERKKIVIINMPRIHLEDWENGNAHWELKYKDMEKDFLRFEAYDIAFLFM